MLTFLPYIHTAIYSPLIIRSTHYLKEITIFDTLFVIRAFRVHPWKHTLFPHISRDVVQLPMDVTPPPPPSPPVLVHCLWRRGVIIHHIHIQGIGPSRRIASALRVGRLVNLARPQCSFWEIHVCTELTWTMALVNSADRDASWSMFGEMMGPP